MEGGLHRLALAVMRRLLQRRLVKGLSGGRLLEAFGRLLFSRAVECVFGTAPTASKDRELLLENRWVLRGIPLRGRGRNFRKKPNTRVSAQVLGDSPPPRPTARLHPLPHGRPFLHAFLSVEVRRCRVFESSSSEASRRNGCLVSGNCLSLSSDEFGVSGEQTNKQTDSPLSREVWVKGPRSR